MRFWDVASGQQVRQVSGSEFAFVEGNDASKHQAGRHILTASNDMLLIYEGDAEGDAASAVACFKAPQPIHRCGATARISAWGVAVARCAFCRRRFWPREKCSSRDQTRLAGLHRVAPGCTGAEMPEYGGVLGGLGFRV